MELIREVASAASLFYIFKTIHNENKYIPDCIFIDHPICL